MKIADYITGTVTAGKRLAVEAELQRRHEGYSRTQQLVEHIAEDGPISTVDLCKALDITSRQVWGMLKARLIAGDVTNKRGLWSCQERLIDDWYEKIDEQLAAKQEAEAAALLTSRGWACYPPQRASK